MDTPEFKNVNGMLIALTDEEKATISAEWAANEIKQIAEQAIEDQRTQDFIDSLPSWSVVSTSIDNIASMADAQVILRKMAKVIYWLAKGQPI